ncbi:MAG: deaminase [Candidatus Paceibacterota bacterium]
MVEKILGTKEDIASFDHNIAQKLFSTFGFQKVQVLSEKNLLKLKNEKLLLVNDKFSRELAKLYFIEKNIKWDKVFLRWDADSVISNHSLKEKKSTKPEDKKWMEEAYKEAHKSGCWWRNVGAVVVKDNSIILRDYNEGIPSDYTPYQVGHIRDFVKAGEKQELSSTIHGEQKIIAEAARKGISLEGTSLYVTHFPCPVCVKIIIHSGIKKCYFSEGIANLSGEKLLKLFGIKLLAVDIKNKKK